MPLDIDIPVRGLTLKAKLWNPDATIKTIGLHGWLDNAASFDALAPLLDSSAFLSFDQAGTGFSDFRPESGTYHLWDDLLDLIAVIDAMGWQQVNLIGHSRGAMLACLLSVSYPEKINQIILLDGFLPPPVASKDYPDQLSGFIHAYSQVSKSWNYHQCRDDLIKLRAKVGGISKESATLLGGRAIHQDKNGYYWRVDPRLKHPSAMKLSEQQIKAVINTVSLKTHVILALDGVGKTRHVQDLIAGHEDVFKLYQLPGHHHFHLDGQVQGIADICSKIL